MHPTLPLLLSGVRCACPGWSVEVRPTGAAKHLGPSQGLVHALSQPPSLRIKGRLALGIPARHREVRKPSLVAQKCPLASTCHGRTAAVHDVQVQIRRCTVSRKVLGDDNCSVGSGQAGHGRWVATNCDI